MFRKVLFLSSLLAISLMAPVTATASWQFEEEPIPGQTFEFHGKTGFQSGTGSIECTVRAHATLEPGTTTAKAGQFEVDGLPTEACKAIGGLAFCQVHGVSYAGLPLTLHVTEATPPTLSITTGDVQYTTTGGFCPTATATLTAATVTATPDNVDAMKTVALSGSTTLHVASGPWGGSQLIGDLKVTPEGIYGI
ncbi:MAG TPA: hypothetical protein VFY48_06065 [Solirubrobacterales bacterium]|nr:hypothetical protein [Solirubrobacterales bacterium]